MSPHDSGLHPIGPGPWRRRAVRALLAASVLMAACSSPDGATSVPLAELVRFAERYDGQRVSTAGKVNTHPDPEHYWIEDDDLNRVEIRRMDRIADRVGETVRVQGEFRYSRQTGRIIEANELTPIP